MPNQRSSDKSYVSMWTPTAIKSKLMKRAERCGQNFSEFLNEQLAILANATTHPPTRTQKKKQAHAKKKREKK